MNGKLSWKMALRQLKAQRHLNIPFILASALMFMMEYIILSLLMNKYVIERSTTLITIVQMGAIICTLLAALFVLYANNFYQKQRYEEMGLYSILGLEKRHIRSILRKEKIIQTLAMIALAIPGGHLFGSVVFLGLNKLMHETGTTLMEYPLRWPIVLGTIIIIVAIMGLCTFVNARKVTRLNPIELIHQQSAGEKEPKSKWIITLLGIGLVGYGYYIALTNTQNVLGSLSQILLAILLVVLGTYALYMGLSIMILKFMKRRQNFYYKPTHFFTVSGMLYRMKANAVSLASIAVLSTGILVTSGLTVSLFRGMEEQVNSTMASDYTVTDDGTEPATKDQLQQVLTKIKQQVKTTDETITEDLLVAAELKNQSQLAPLDPPADNKDANINAMYYMDIHSLSDFNQLHKQNQALKDNEVLMTATTPVLRQHKTLTIAGKEYHVKTLDQSYLSSKLAVDYFLLVLPDNVSLTDIGNYYYMFNREMEKLPATPAYSLQFNVSGNKDVFEKNRATIEKDYQVSIDSRQEAQKLIYELNGGFLFLGIVVGIVLSIGVGLMLYYKQVSEGMEDRENFRIMAQVGLPDSLIHKTIHQQILTVFLLPLVTAVIHIGVAFGILRTLLRLLAVRDMTSVLMNFGFVTLAFVIVYGIFFILTQRTYYQIIKPKSLAAREE
ncbi:MAG: ABC transporter permease [Aerococcus sp.]|nr:ABC transporter permease [Aerococcus sp.]